MYLISVGKLVWYQEKEHELTEWYIKEQPGNKYATTKIIWSKRELKVSLIKIKYKERNFQKKVWEKDYKR